MSARDVMTASMPNSLHPDERDRLTRKILEQLAHRGYRLLTPGELDDATIERCAEIAAEEVQIMRDLHREHRGDQKRSRFASRAMKAAHIRTAIRNLKGNGNG